MRLELRTGLIIGTAAALVAVFYCVWLWNGERQVARHTEALFRAIEQKKWTAVGDLVAEDYRDQWNEDRALVLARIRLTLSYGGKFRITANDIECKIDNGAGVWRGKVSIVGDDAAVIRTVATRVNSLTTRFELQWRHVSGKPWDWKLVRVSNPDLEIPAGFD